MTRKWTGVFVTHNIAEAVFLSQRVLVLTRRPARIAADIPIPFSYPRTAALRAEAEFDVEAQRKNLTRAEGLNRLEHNDDPLARERGQDMGRAIGRAKRLNEQVGAINSAGPLMRLYVVATSFDPEIARSTLDNYEPAEPLSVGALMAGGLAALLGWAATRVIASGQCGMSAGWVHRPYLGGLM